MLGAFHFNSSLSTEPSSRFSTHLFKSFNNMREPSSSKKSQTGGGQTVKLKVKTVRTIDFNQVKQAEKYEQIVQTRSGGYELLVPTKLNEELKPYFGKDFDMDVVEEGETLRVILTNTKGSNADAKSDKATPAS